MTKPQTISQFFKCFPDDETCLNHLFEVRFGQGFECPSCERSSNWYRIKAERAYSCQWCGHHLHPTVGTPFEKTRTPLQSWFYAIFLFTTTRNGVAAKELQRQLGVTYKTAWRMADLIRKHMADVDGETPIGGEGKEVEIDETLIGGVARTGKQGRNLSNKTVVLGMVERGGDVVTTVVPDVKRATLVPAIKAHVAEGSTVNTDHLHSYAKLGEEGYRHDRVNHNVGSYISDTGAHVQTIEGFWSQLKRSINGTHIHVSGKHLWKYAKEAEYRFNRRNRPEAMLPELLSTFRPLSAE
ncbi:IS1595 family transposase [Altererythrobacter sp. FM1]|uniref:IS1595 family transposase n=1 Tax=Tsuneonella flava TaxID=2055955 RepID=UPI000C7F7BF0|nr:IS1595 family transposase [Tsuneonella flava]ROT95611.1 IS1595 family transposase [Altererythrobacter sp. FM1]